MNITIVREEGGKPTLKVFAHFHPEEPADAICKASITVDAQALAAITVLEDNILEAISRWKPEAAAAAGSGP
jgi:hypothetical protein